MAKDKFLLVSLSESKTKELAQAVSNETCRKILDYLAEEEATESELSKELDVPLSTVHYNLQQLKKAGLVNSEEFHYSEKGKEVEHYKLANKYIIIAPKSTYGLKGKLKNILPVGLIVAAGAGVVYFVKNLNKFGARTIAESSLEKEAAPMMATEGAQAAEAGASIFSNVFLWFFMGALVALGLYLLVDYLRKRR